MGRFFAFALIAAIYPTLLFAVMLMLALPQPKRLLVGYWFGAALASITFGLLLVFAFDGSRSEGTSKHTVNPILNVAIGALILLLVVVVATGHDGWRRSMAERRRQKAVGKPTPRWRRQLGKGTARDTFVVAVLLSFPSASMIAAMQRLSHQNLSTGVTVVYVVVFVTIMLALLELPLVSYLVAPAWTGRAVARFNDWLVLRGGRVALGVGAALGLLLVARGIANW